jgi:hypothetical protein
MKLADARAAYESLSGLASQIIRQLSLAGIALIWLFKSGDNPPYVLDQRLLRAALCIFVALFLDLMQYLVGTLIWFLYFRYRERSGTTEASEFLAPPALNAPMWSLFAAKAVLMSAAYAIYIIPFLYSRFVA